jgi:deoxyribose-phosphate aldolase
VNLASLARIVDHTLLTPEATPADVERACREGVTLGVFAVCVSPSLVAVATRTLAATEVAVVTVCGFPSGAHAPPVKAREAELAVESGAREVDMVIDLGRAKAGDWAAVERDIREVRRVLPHPALLKVIVESAALTDDEIVAACAAADSAGADFVKTSTGFHPAGGATVSAVRLIAGALARTADRRLGVKASGGIRTTAQALALVAAGATRLGVSRTGAVLDGLPG